MSDFLGGLNPKIFWSKNFYFIRSYLFLFCFIILFYFILFILFYFIFFILLLYFILFYFISFYLILFYFISFIFTFHFILFYFLFYFIFMLCGIPTLIGLDQWKYLFLFLKKNATSEHCILNIIIIFFFWLIIISEIGSNGQCSKIVNFNRTEAGLISKWARISPAVQWCYQNQSNCTLWRCTASHEIENFNLFLF